jgi:hypothetical protein
VKLPGVARKLARRTMGMARAQPITPAALHALAAREPILVIGVGVLRAGTADPRLPGEQRAASLGSLASVIADVPRSHPIILHCG